MSHRSLDRVGLETSLKPFPSWSEADLEATATTLFDQWRDLIGAARSVAVLLWIADGSEILEWDLDLDREVTWASSVGFSNTEYDAYPHAVTPDNTAQPFRADVPALHYRDIRLLVATIRQVGERMLGCPCRWAPPLTRGRSSRPPGSSTRSIRRSWPETTSSVSAS